MRTRFERETRCVSETSQAALPSEWCAVERVCEGQVTLLEKTIEAAAAVQIRRVRVTSDKVLGRVKCDFKVAVTEATRVALQPWREAQAGKICEMSLQWASAVSEWRAESGKQCVAWGERQAASAAAERKQASRCSGSFADTIEICRRHAFGICARCWLLLLRPPRAPLDHTLTSLPTLLAGI